MRLPRRLPGSPLLGVALLGLALGFYFRFSGLAWDEGQGLHPDERFIVMTLEKLQWPASPAEYFHTARSPLNPFNAPDVNLFVYGQLPLTLLKAFQGGLVAVTAKLWPTSSLAALSQDQYRGTLFLGRFLSALFDSLSMLVLLIWGRRQGARVGVLAAILLGFTALHFQQAHFFVVDTFAVTFLLLAMVAATGWVAPTAGRNEEDALAPPARMKGWLPLACGLAVGLAMACKISSGLFLILLPVFVALRWKNTGQRQNPLWYSLECLLLLVGLLLAFRLAHPIAFRGEGGIATLGGLLDLRAPVGKDLTDPTAGTFGDSLRRQQAISSGEEDPPWNIQWVGRRNYLFPLRNLALWGVGWPLLLAAVAGMALAFKRWRHAPDAVLIAALWSLAVFVYYGGWFSKFTRYYLVMTPALSLLAAWFLLEVNAKYGAASTRLRHWRMAPLFLVVATTGLWALACHSIYRRPHPRLQASRWMLHNLPRGTVIANETAWDDGLPIGGAGDFQKVDLKLFEPDDGAKRDHLLNSLEKTQWLAISSPRAWAAIPRLVQRWPLTSAYYLALFSGRLGYRPVMEFASYPTLSLGPWSLEFPDDTVEEALVVYDHPRVVLFSKTPQWSRAAASRELPADLLHYTQPVNLQELHRAGYRVEEEALPFLPRAPRANPLP